MKYVIKIHVKTGDRSSEESALTVHDYQIRPTCTEDALDLFKTLHGSLYILIDVEWVELWEDDNCIGRLKVTHELDEEEEEEEEEEEDEDLLVV